MATTGLDGDIITIESLAYEATNDWNIDTDTSLSSLSNKNVFILRVFYQFGEVTHNEIGVADFRPTQTSKATFFKRPKFEKFDKVIERASSWLYQHPELRFVNAQSIDFKMKGNQGKVDSRQMAYTEHGDYMRVFRITYIRRKECNVQTSTDRVVVSTRLFLPYHRSDTISDIKIRQSDWANAMLNKYRSEVSKYRPASFTEAAFEEYPDLRNYPKILSAETVEVFAKDYGDTDHMEKAANDDTFLANRFGNKNAYLFFSLRIFYNSECLQPDDGVTLTTTDSARSTPKMVNKKSHHNDGTSNGHQTHQPFPFSSLR